MVVGESVFVDTDREVVDAKELEPAIDADIARFNECFQQELGNEPLVRSELAILKTYLWFKTHAEAFVKPVELTNPNEDEHR